MWGGEGGARLKLCYFDRHLKSEPYTLPIRQSSKLPRLLVAVEYIMQ